MSRDERNLISVTDLLMWYGVDVTGSARSSQWCWFTATQAGLADGGEEHRFAALWARHNWRMSQSFVWLCRLLSRLVRQSVASVSLFPVKCNCLCLCLSVYFSVSEITRKCLSLHNLCDRSAFVLWDFVQRFRSLCLKCENHMFSISPQCHCAEWINTDNH